MLCFVIKSPFAFFNISPPLLDFRLSETAHIKSFKLYLRSKRWEPVATSAGYGLSIIAIINLHFYLAKNIQ